ncbi:hypothetical protein JTE90_013611 [Oedothorax gibbosus]|uniref:Uncharacterized protein n=1 Tax=Oedothorax gibbosus TaxID=931172 RepID=A0AAV6TMS0_9ARAC|nr:hypothetical protein JTE90_013611 [Oedothorax gibbosus]
MKELIENSGSIKEENILKAKAIADEATLESVVSITLPLNHHEDYEETNFESFDVSSKDSQEKSHKVNLVGHNSAEASLSVDSTSTTVLQTRGRRKRFIGWIQYKCLSVFKYCCPCTTTKNSSKEV